MRIHPTAIVHPDARLGPGCDVGPYAVIDAGVCLGSDCVVGPHVHLTGNLTAGEANRFHAGAVLGDAPQDLKYHGQPTRLRIGNGNQFREHVTVHRSNRESEDTVIGNRNLLMAGSHVGHNCTLGDACVLANGALLAGHVTVEDRAFISGNCLVHQFCRVGRLALMQGGSAISRDLPACCIARGDNRVAGLNVVGLRRAGVTASERLRLRAAYHVLFRSRLPLAAAADRLEALFAGDPWIADWILMARSTRRGLCIDRSRTGLRSEGGDDGPPD